MDEARNGTSAETRVDPFTSTVAVSELDAALRRLAEAPPREPQVSRGTTLGRFVLLEQISSGGYGVVWEARDRELHRHVAVKVMRTRGGSHDREAGDALALLLRHEAETAARLNHPNIVTLHDFGTFDGCPYLVLELLHGETLQRRLAQGPLGAGDAIACMIQVAQALVYAHGHGVVHLDVKPGNVFLTREGPVKLLDFGLSRLHGAIRGGASVDGAGMTREAGTPAYMAPEQWSRVLELTQRALASRDRADRPLDVLDERADLYAAGLVLYEMLTGELPWPAADPRVAALAPWVAPPVRGVPPELAAVIARCLEKQRDARLPNAALLLEGLMAAKRSLESAQIMRRRRRVRWAAAGAVPLIAGLAWAAAQVAAQVRVDRRIQAHLDEADASIAGARQHEPMVEALRRRALAGFDRGAAHAEESWTAALAAGAQVDRMWAHAGQTLERAFVLDVERADVRRRLGETLVARAAIAERDHRLAQRDELIDRLATYGDAAAQARWRTPATLTVATTPPGASIVVMRHEGKAPRRLVPVAAPPATSGAELRLAAGSYVLFLAAPGRSPVRYPVLLGRGERHHAALALPDRVPDGFVYVPPGRFLFGTADESFRPALGAQPEHPVTTGAYLIARHEVTFGEWIAFLEALPAAEQARRMPRVDGVARSTAAIGSEANDLELRRRDDGRWQLTLRGQTVGDTEPFVYRDRATLISQPWLRFPVTGVSFEDGQAFTAWLHATGRVPGARPCNEHEWERAARGADGRLYPHGDRLGPGDANFDETYGRMSRAFGPDEVGRHPESDSPFGVADLAGNVWEWASSVAAERAVVERGGSWFQDRTSARSDNRSAAEPTLHAVLIGLRICATFDDAR